MRLEMRYFVLKPKSKHKDDRQAQASRAAMLAYADNIRDVDSVFAEDLEQWASYEHRENLNLST